MPEVQPVAQRPGRRAERDPGPRDRVGRVGHDLGAAHDPLRPADGRVPQVEPVAQRPRRRAERDLRPRDRVGRVGPDLGRLGVGAAVPPTIRASNTIVTTAASSRVYRPTIVPGSTSSPVSSQVSRMAAWWTVSSTSRKPPGWAHSPTPGSMPRRISTTFPSSSMGSVVTTSRGFTYAMWPQASHDSRWRSSPSTSPKRSGDPHRLQKLSDDAIQFGTPRPDARSDDRPSGPRSKSSIRRAARGCRPRPARPAR